MLSLTHVSQWGEATVRNGLLSTGNETQGAFQADYQPKEGRFRHLCHSGKPYRVLTGDLEPEIT